MSISLSIEFQEQLQKLLEGNNLLTNYVKQIFQTLKQGTKYPYIFHKINEVNILPSSNFNIYEISGEINIYFRDSSQKDLKTIINLVEESISSLKDKFMQFKFICGKVIKAEFTSSHDLLTNRIQMIFLCSIQER